MGKYLSRDALLGSSVKTQEVGAFGGLVLVKELDALTMQEITKSGAFVANADGTTSTLDMGKVNLIRVAARHMVDENLEPILKMTDVQKLASKGSADILTVATAAMGLSGLAVSEEDVEVTAEAEPEKN